MYTISYMLLSIIRNENTMYVLAKNKNKNKNI